LFILVPLFLGTLAWAIYLTRRPVSSALNEIDEGGSRRWLDGQWLWHKDTGSEKAIEADRKPYAVGINH
jgi:hypothetical protein